MAEEVISIVADKFSGYLLQESSLIYGIQDEIGWLERELRRMVCFVKDAISEKKDDDEIVNIWVRDNIAVAYEAEEFFEIFLLQARDVAPAISLEHVLARCSPTTSLENFFLMVGKCFPMFTCLVFHNRLGKEFFEFLKFRISEISERRATLDFASLDEIGEHGGSSRFETLREASRLSSQYDDDACIVGFAEAKKNVVEKLLNDEKRLCVISIVGVGGLGKTTLAKNISETNTVRKEFTACFWISVSPDNKVPDILKKMVEEVSRSERLDFFKAEELGKDLHEMLLSRGKYLMVVDDIWEKKAWDRVRKFLPDMENGSRVLITTRSIDIARCADPSITPYELSLLDEEQSRRLFLRKVYPNQNVETFPEDLKIVGQNLVEKLQGLPLALLVLGGFLSVIVKNQDTWSSVLKSLNWDSVEIGACLDVLEFSYEALPDYLKPCFLYLASFPEVVEINAKRLMRLWTAEGFIPTNVGVKREETAEDYLEELVARYMVQVAGRGRDGRIKKIRIHEHLRELCRIEARKYGFLQFEGPYADKEQSLPSNVGSLHRLALHGIKPKHYIDLSSKKWKTPNLRTFHLRYSGGGNRISFKGMPLLRVIDVKLRNSWTELPKEIGSLVHLRYLKWSSGPGVDYHLIKNLPNLQTVDVRPFLVDADESIGDLINLQFLGDISAGIWIERGLAKLVNLQKLHISGILDTDWSALLKSLKKLHCLVCLTLISHSPVPPQFLPMFSNHHTLRHLTLDGDLSELPDSKAFPPNLTNLTLTLSFLKKDPMETLKQLPNLICLKLRDSAFSRKKLRCRAGGFKKLRQLVLRYMLLEEWKVDSGALPSLIHLTIHTCDALKKLPNGLQHVTTLQHLTLVGMPPEFMKTATKGKDWHKIKHVRYIYT